MSKHTPGPWEVRGASTRFAAFNVHGPKTNVVRDVLKEANAHLIAAAPDLLEALKALRGCFNAEGELLIHPKSSQFKPVAVEEGEILFEFDGDDQASAGIIPALVAAECQITGFGETTASLEDIFMQVTRGTVS